MYVRWALKLYHRFERIYKKGGITILKYLGIGVFLTIIALAIGVLTSDWNLFLKIIAVAAVVPLLLAGLLTGAFVDGDRNRANYHTEPKEYRQGKNKWVIRFLLLGVPNFTLLIIFVVIGLVTR
ncbi:hypothetical protein GH741_03315 [Aquibacillus halophilus]|uniref:DUF5316 domain-containing protein n=1 Tax=Aquibacillus halophilus TaxID=930132 RepID=A0A6A8D8W6_9BACI|nr:DUF5316 family protein [Aquibacillus halophilus]MRH41700.1 hypothetical protein [Aquibacillus halophilus]